MNFDWKVQPISDLQMVPKRKTKPSKSFKKMEKERQQRHELESVQSQEEYPVHEQNMQRYSMKSIASIKNCIKREREIRLASLRDVQSMRLALPSYNLAEIRQFRLPFHQALTMNLEEAGFPSSAWLITSLIDYQELMRQKSGPGSTMFGLPQLKFAKDELGILSRSLKLAESFHQAQCYTEECDEFLHVGVYFAFNLSDWWWLGEHLLIQSIRVSTSYSDIIGRKFEALSRFIYAKFLLENIKDYKTSLIELQITRALAMNKVWTCKSYFPEVRGTLFMLTNEAIFECLITEVKLLMKKDVKKAVILADQARRRAVDACFRNGETRALVIKGICEMTSKRPKSAINSFLRALNIQQRFGTIEGKCKIRIHLAKAYLMDNCFNSSLNTLMELKSDAEEHGLSFYLGQAYKNLGGYYLLIGEPNKATPLLDEAIKILNVDNALSGEMSAARNLKAVSGGLQLFPTFIEIIKRAGKEPEYFLKLLNWKNDRDEFWSDRDLIIRYTSRDEIILESQKKVEQSRANVLDQKFKSLSAKTLLEKKSKMKSDIESQANLLGVPTVSDLMIMIPVDEINVSTLALN